VVGDVDPQKVYELAKQTYGKHEPENIEAPRPQVEIPQEGERRITLKGTTKTPTIFMGFHTPTLVTAKTPEEKQEIFALEVLSSILDGDDSARLTKNLVRKEQILAGAGAGYDGTDRLTTLFMFEATPSKKTEPARAEQAIWQEIDKLKTELVTEAELQRVLAQSEAQYIYHQDSIQAQANVLGALVSVGLPADTLDNWVAELRKVTPQQVQAVAQKYLQKDRVTVATLLPNGEQADKTKHVASHQGAH